MNKVQIVDNAILVNGQQIGRIEGTSRDVWVMGTEGGQREFIARFKHAKPGASARDFIKYVFARMSLADYLARAKAGEAPLKIAEAIGYTSLVVRQTLRKEGVKTLAELFAKQDAARAAAAV